jgi:hypothetical protein
MPHTSDTFERVSMTRVLATRAVAGGKNPGVSSAGGLWSAAHSPGARLASSLQIDPPTSALEREADSVADELSEEETQAAAAPGAAAGASDASGDDGGSAGGAPHGPGAGSPSALKPLPTRGGSGRLSGAAAGRALDSQVRPRLEERFGFDLSRVRIHSDVEAGRLSAEVGARAFTHGQHIYFASGAYQPAARAGAWLLAHELTHVVQQANGRLHSAVSSAASVQAKCNCSAAGNGPSCDKCRSTAAEAEPPSRIQRFPDGGDAARIFRSPEPERESQSESQVALVAGAGLIVEDDAPAAAGQLRKSEFLAAVRVEACRAVDAELARVGRDTRGCPYVERALRYYAGRTAAHVERAVRRFAPETASARSAEALVAPLSARFAAGAASWATTGEIPDVPDDLRAELTSAALGSSLLGAVVGLASGIGRAFAALFKTESGAPAPAPGIPLARLGALSPRGQPLEASARGRMESAFGDSFADVRVHTGREVAALSSELGARAFTIGQHVFFGAAEYHPGDPRGDALLAHELAHVMQQRPALATGALAPGAASRPASGGDAALEADADAAAVGAVASLWLKPAPGAEPRARFRPRGKLVHRLSRSLGLQRCSSAPGVDRFRVNDKLDAPDATRTIYFPRDGVTLDTVEERKVDRIVSEDAAADYSLYGYRSGDEAAEIGPRRRDNVIEALRTHEPAHTGTLDPGTAPDTTSDIRYQTVRKAELVPIAEGETSAPPSLPDCSVTPDREPARVAVEAAFPIARDILDGAIRVLEGDLTDAQQALVNTLFGAGATAPPDTKEFVKGKLRDIRTFLADYVMSHWRRHVAGCDSLCSRPAYWSGDARQMTLCNGFVNGTPAHNASTLIHETGHGTPGLFTQDLAYASQRRIVLLSTSDARRNTDSYVALARNLHTPGSMRFGGPGDTYAGFADAAEQLKAQRALAFLQKWLEKSEWQLEISFRKAREGQPDAAMDRVRDRVGLSSCSPGPEDVTRIAGVHYRVNQLNQPFRSAITVQRATSESSAWRRGVNPNVVVLADEFFAGTDERVHVRRLLDLLIADTPSIAPDLRGLYRDVIDEFRQEQGIGP